MVVPFAICELALCKASGQGDATWFVFCEGEVIIQGDERPVCGVAQVVDCHGVTVGHQEREKKEEQQEVKGEGEKHSKNTAHVHGWDEYEKTSASGLEPCGVMNESNEDTKDSVQVCSILHVVHVHVRRVLHVIVHYGLTDVEGVLVVVHTFT